MQATREDMRGRDAMRAKRIRARRAMNTRDKSSSDVYETAPWQAEYTSLSSGSGYRRRRPQNDCARSGSPRAFNESRLRKRPWPQRRRVAVEDHGDSAGLVDSHRTLSKRSHEARIRAAFGRGYVHGLRDPPGGARSAGVSYDCGVATSREGRRSSG